MASKAPNRQTLRAWLTQPDPVLKLAILYKSAADEQQMKPWPEVPSWKHWTEFSLTTIEDSLGFLLDTKFDFPPFLTDFHKSTGKPDWASLRATVVGKKPPLCSFPGDTKACDSEFPESASPKRKKTTSELWAEKYLRQISHYSLKRKTRPTGQGIVPEVQSIKWSTEPDPKNLTIPLALFGMQVFASLDHKVRNNYVRMAKEYQNALEAVRVGMKKAGL
ncbi:hypothetical protein SLS55_010409 [Diplodia seriata]|uniref:Uncharacterized protein n=1 Tax=Diplodia seriata TaxID=420778 RepID=A0ABR3BYG0_9PEZI